MGGVRQGGRGAFENKADGMGSILSLKSKYIQ